MMLTAVWIGLLSVRSLLPHSLHLPIVLVSPIHVMF